MFHNRRNSLDFTFLSDLKLLEKAIVVIPKRRREVGGLFRTGDGQTTGRRDGQSLFNDVTEGEERYRQRGGEGKIKKKGAVSRGCQLNLFKKKR